MTPRLSGHLSTFGLVFFVLKSLLGITRQWSVEKFAILTLKPRSHVGILIYRTWAIGHRRVPSNDPRNNCRTHFGSISLLANFSKCLQRSKTGLTRILLLAMVKIDSLLVAGLIACVAALREE